MWILDELRVCPSCSRDLKVSAVLNCNSMGAVIWSDGYGDRPFLPNESVVGMCPHCSALVWESELRTSKNTDDKSQGIFGYSASGAPQLKCLDANGLLAAIATNQDEGRQRYLRMTLWHFFNQVVRRWWDTWDCANVKHFEFEERLAVPREALRERYQTSVPAPIQPPEFRSNLIELLQLFSVNSADDGLLRAEAFRELGQFDECLVQLADAGHARPRMSAQIAIHAHKGESKVFQYSF